MLKYLIISSLLFFSCVCEAQVVKVNIEKGFLKFINKEKTDSKVLSDSLILVKFHRSLTDSEISTINPRRRFSSETYVIRTKDTSLISLPVFYKARVNSLWKASDRLAYEWDKSKNEILNVRFVFESLSQIPDYLKIYKIKYVNLARRVITIDLPLKDLISILDRNEVVFADIIQSAKEEMAVSELNLSDMGVSAVHNLYPDIDGRNVTISIKEGQFDLTDIDLLGKELQTGLNKQPITGHATTMATLSSGLGNSFIKGKGVAPAAFLTSADFEDVMPDDLSTFKSGNVTVQNHSYGTTIDNIYGAEATAYDQQVFESDTIVHVFSSGNKGTDFSEYGQYQRMLNFANLTGSFKQAKNVLVIGGIDQENTAIEISSRGPAYDGRVKPELVTFGESGTSSAAALTSGVVALLQQKFRNMFNKSASSALIRGILINSADDVGRPQVDYVTGFGKLNALRAINTLVEKRFKTAEVVENQEVIFPVEVEEKQSNLKITLTWNDPPAKINSVQSIVNHLDLSLQTPNRDIIYPWVLSSYPHPDSLSKPATRKIDNLNNVQQLSLENLIPGTYTVHIKGRKVLEKIQKFSVVYQLTPNNQFSWDYPLKDDFLFAGQENYIRWSNSFIGKIGKLSISYDDGNTWRVLNENVVLDKTFFKLNAPDLLIKSILKMEIEGREFRSGAFVISNVPQLKVGYNCEKEISFHWKPQSSVSSYTIYNIKNNKLVPLLNTKDSLIVIDKTIISSPYFALEVNANNFSGLKSLTINYLDEKLACYVRKFYAQVFDDNIKLYLDLGTSYNLKKIIWEKESTKGVFEVVDDYQIKDEAMSSYIHLDANPRVGVQRYRVTLITKDEKSIQTEILPVNFMKGGGILLHPNPCRDELNIITEEDENYTLMLYNAIGQLIFHDKVKGTKTINTSTFASGIYQFVIFKDKTVVQRGKLIKI